MTGDLPSVQYFFNNPGQYQTFVAIERDAKGDPRLAALAALLPTLLVLASTL